MTVGPMMTPSGEEEGDKRTELQTITRSLLVGLLRQRENQTVSWEEDFFV